MDKRIERILPLVQKPARYTGGEYGEIHKDLSDVELRMALCFPDVYEIGMSNTGMRILYRVLNDMQLIDSIGQRTNILFLNVKMNEPVDDGQFTFDIPEGADVIQE